MRARSGLRARVARGTRAAIERLRGRARGGDEPNVLAISDLHLGFDLRRGGAPSRPPPQDGPLAALLDHHAARREDGRPWRLVVAGDMVDFIGMTLTPDPGEEVPFEVTAEERLGGLGPEPLKAVWKLGKVVARHRLFFERLAAFLAAGNELVVIRGNHDQEWSLPEVQRAFVAALAALAPPAARLELASRVRFRDWFHLEPGRLYIEHGHLHDEFASVADFGPRRQPRLHESVSTLALRLFGNRHDGLDLNEVERWSIFDFVRWGVRSGELGRIARDYVAMCGRVLAFSLRQSARTTLRSLRRLARLPRAVATEDDRIGALKAMLRGVREDQEKLARDLLGLVKPPAEQSVFACAQMLYVDRLVLALLAAAGLASCAMADLVLPWRATGAVLDVALAVGLNALLDRARRADSHPKLRRAAHRLAVLFGVRLVVMGHSHRPVDEPVGEGARYVNLGTWLAPSRDDTGALSCPHLVVRGREATLRRWRVRAGEAVVA